MLSNKKSWNSIRLYFILDKDACGSRDKKLILKKAIEGGVDIVQYRDKTSTTKAMIREASILMRITAKHNVPFIINDRLDVTLGLDAEGVHLGQEDMPPSLAREILGKKKIIGLSCHSRSQLKKGMREPVDYLGLGPIFKTKTKPRTSPIGERPLRETSAGPKRPVFAIGGISLRNVDEIIKASCANARVALCREICLARDVRKQTKKLKDRLTRQQQSPA